VKIVADKQHYKNLADRFNKENPEFAKSFNEEKMKCADFFIDKIKNSQFSAPALVWALSCAIATLCRQKMTLEEYRDSLSFVYEKFQVLWDE
jgi:hypothetical protein